MDEPLTRSRRSILGLVVSALAACSSGSPPKVPVTGIYQSGMRLRARITDAGDGARRFDGWTDRQLETPCTFRLAADGVRRCVPMGDVAYPLRYLDAACSVPATSYLDPDASAPFFATAGALVPAPAAGCGADLIAAGAYEETTVDAWRVGPEQPDRTIFDLDGSGACIQSPASNGPVHILQPIAAAQLVAATVTVEARGTSMAVEVLTANDGSKEIGQAFDTTLGRPCFPSWVYAVTDDYRCYVATAQAAAVTPQGCSSGALASCADELVLEGGSCTPSFYNLAAAPCGSSSGAGLQFHELGTPFDPKRFPSLTSALVGTGRLRLVITRPSDDDRALFVNSNNFVAQDRYIPGPFFDTERQLPCDAAAFEDGSIRCLTTDTLWDETYSDPACTNPIGIPTTPQAACATSPLGPTPQLAFRSPGRLYTLGPLVQRTEAYVMNQTVPPTCDRLAFTAMYYDLVPADPAMLAALTPLTE